MSIISKTDVKSQLGYSSDYDTQLDAIIPGAIKKAFAYCKNYFHVPGQLVQSYSITFDADAKTITLSGGGFVTSGLNPIRFQSGMYIHVEGSILNNKVFLTSTVTNTVITLDSSETLYDEEAGAFVSIYMMMIDDGFKSALVEYVGWRLESAKKQGLTSERMDDYSANFKGEREAMSDIFSGYKKISSSR